MKGGGRESSFYLLRGVALVVFFYKVWGMDVCSAFPCVVTFRVALPLDEILEVF